MKLPLIAYLRCPICRTELVTVDQPDESGIIWTGGLTCKNAHTFAIENGIPYMLSPELPGYEAKMGEAVGWVNISKAQGWYQPTPAIDLALPHVVSKLGWDPVEASSWLGTEYSFSHMMKHLVRPGMRVLEIGAARTWAGRYFVEAGCEYTACDIVADPNIGLGRAYFFMNECNCHYELVATDAEYLPFANNTFDLVFAVAALHHALDLPRMIKEMARVTKRGGMVAGLGEGVRSFRASPDAAGQAEEKTYGINEHVHTLSDYCFAFLQSGLWVTKIYRAVGHEWFLSEEMKQRMRRWAAIPYCGEWLVTIKLVGFTHDYDGLSLYGKKI